MRLWKTIQALGRSRTSNRRSRRRSLRFEPLEPRRVLATYTVNSLSDTTADDEFLTLREAIETVNANLGNDTIEFETGLSGSILLRGEPLVVSKYVRIVGPGAAQLSIDANQNSSVMVVDNRTRLEMSGLTLTGGRGAGLSGGGLVARLYSGFTLSDMVFRDNGTPGQGGAVQAVAENHGVIERTLFEDNYADVGGAVYVGNQTSLTITDSTFRNNRATREGGAVTHAFYPQVDTGVRRIYNSTFTGNTAQRGGAVHGGGLTRPFGITRSTFVGNSADTAAAIWRCGVIQSTITQNTTNNQTGAVDWVSPNENINTRDSIIAGNLGGNLGDALSGVGPGNVVDVDPGLHPLADNGGYTQTMALRPGSPAIDATDVQFAGNDAKDQRGAPRISGDLMDAGAYEYHPPTPGVTIITHGWQMQRGPADAPPDWTLEMARAIGARTPGANIYFHRANPDSDNYGEWDLLVDDWSNSGNPDDELILVFDWQWDSDDTEEGWMQTAADSLFAGLVDAPFDVLSRPIHFIGHSRGAVLNSLVVAQMGERFPDLIVDQVTSLDPHPIEAAGIAGGRYEADDPAVLIYDNVAYADTYHRRDSTDHESSYQDDFDFDGLAVPGAGLNLELNESLLDEDDQGEELGLRFEHSDTHLWYLATINTTANTIEGEPITQVMQDTWWLSGRAYASSLEANSGRDNVGFARSRIGQLSRETLAVTDGRPLSEAPVDFPVVVNGDFEFGGPISDEIPGWERHGGTHSGDLTNGRLHLGESTLINHRKATHNPLYIPANAKFLHFDMEVTDTSNDDELEVRIGDTLVATLPLETASANIVRPIWLGGFTDSVNTIGLELDFGALIESDVYIDNVTIYRSDLPWQNPVDVFDMDASGRVNVRDAFLAIDEIRSRGANAQLPPEGPSDGNGPFVDMNGNNRIDLLDAFGVIDRVRDGFGSGGGEGEAAGAWYDAQRRHTAAPLRATRGAVHHATDGEASVVIQRVSADDAKDTPSREAAQLDSIWAEQDAFWNRELIDDSALDALTED